MQFNLNRRWSGDPTASAQKHCSYPDANRDPASPGGLQPQFTLAKQ
jgi:hypothetical protein